MRRRAVALGCVAFMAACGSHVPTSPSPFAPGSGSPTAAGPPAPAPAPLPAPVGGGPTMIPGAPISAGVRTEVRVEGTDSTCFPNWDASGHCRAFDLTTSQSGRLTITLELPSQSRGFHDPEVILVAPDGAWDFTSDPWPVRHVAMDAQSDKTYRIVVISYGPFPDTVYLRADLK